MHRRSEFSFPGSSPARGQHGRALSPVNAVAPRPREEEEVRWLRASRQGSPDYSSGTPSPPLWAHHEHQYRMCPASAGSSPSRAQAIAGYRREMLDLVRGLPESAYELSLRDIVEHARPSSPSPPSSSTPLPTPRTPPPPPSSNADVSVTPPQRGHEPATADEQAAAQSVGGGNKKQGGRKKQRAAVRRQRSRSLERSVSLDTGLLIKFFVPLAIRGGKKKVSPSKPDGSKDARKKKNENKKKNQQQGTKEDGRKRDEEWWTNSEFSEPSEGSSSRTSSTGSSNDSIRNGNPRAPARSKSRKRNGCYAFFRAHKSKNGVSKD